MDRRVLECGCMFLNDTGDDWKPCPRHVNSRLSKVRRAHAECLPLVPCSACGEENPVGTPCTCGAGE